MINNNCAQFNGQSLHLHRPGYLADIARKKASQDKHLANYQTPNFFRQRMFAAWHIISSSGIPIAPLNKKQIQDAYHLYMNGLQIPNQVIGNNDLLWEDLELIRNFGATVGAGNVSLAQKIKQLFRRKTPFLSRIFLRHRQQLRRLNTELENGNGMILFGDYWTIIANDALIVSKCHAISREAYQNQHEGEIYFAAHPTFFDNPMLDVWDHRNARLKVTGREIIGLLHFGFESEVYITQDGTTFIQFNLKNIEGIHKAGMADLGSYATLMLDPKWQDYNYVAGFFKRLFAPKSKMAWHV